MAHLVVDGDQVVHGDHRLDIALVARLVKWSFTLFALFVPGGFVNH